MEAASFALGGLNAASALIPDKSLFIYAYVRKEAVLSSQIEGSRSSLADLLLAELDEAPGVPVDDITEVSNYVAALEHGLTRMRSGFPLSNRLVREMHGILLSSGRGSLLHPGEFRASQNWIGGRRPGDADFVPPPPHAVAGCMGELEEFIHATDDGMPTLLRAGLAHLQFETIHPFLDGNGRVGRLLIAMMLCHAGALQEPLLYLSLFFKQHRSVYYQLLDRVRRTGDWERWLAFFLDGVRETAEGAVAASLRLTQLFESDRARIQQTGRRARLGIAGLPGTQVAPDTVSVRRQRTHRTNLSHRGGDDGIADRAGHRARDYRPATQPPLRLRSVPLHPERGDGAVMKEI